SLCRISFFTLSLHDALPICFGFTSAFRNFLAVGNGQAIRAHMILLATATTLFAIIFATQFSLFGKTPVGYVSPVGTSLIVGDTRSEEHTSELQSRFDLVCRL